ncbi:MAG: hypothetical protein JWR16_1695 [Nevskia sp.]|nr:hypothetical protein [Nevskia sp.]
MRRLFGRGVESFGELAMHEAELLDEHFFALQERLAVARKARDVGELLRNQWDLVPATTARLRRNHRQRLALWRRLRQQPSATGEH